MFQPVTGFIAFRYLLGKEKDRFGRFITWLSTIGITVGVIALIIVLSVMNGLENDIQKSTLYYMPQALITTPENKLNTNRYPLSSLTDSIPNVTRAAPLIITDVVLQSQGGLFVSRLLGVDPTVFEPATEYTLGKKLNELEAGKYQIIIGRALAQKLDLQLGSQVRLLVTQASLITPIGRIPSQRLFTVAGIFNANSGVESEQVYLHQQDAARLLHFPDKTISGWRLYLLNPLNIDKTVSYKLPDPLIFKDWREQKGEFFQAVSMEKNMMSLLISLIILVAAFNMITSLGLLVMEKQSEVAILQTLGLTRQKIMGIFILQGAASGIMGTLCGTFIGLLSAMHINQICQWFKIGFQDVKLPVLISPYQIMAIVMLSIIVALFSTLYPAWQATKVQPAEALRYE